MKAFLVDCEQENGAKLYFAETANQAKCYAANEEGIDYIEVKSCLRRPQYDQYSPGPVPPIVLIEDGWWFECWGCNCRVEQDMSEVWDENDEAVECDGPIVRNNGIWCTSQCQARYDAKQAEENRLNAEVVAAVLAKWPKAEKVTPYMRGDHKQCAWFLFGGEDSAKWAIGEETVHISGRDVEAWMRFKQLSSAVDPATNPGHFKTSGI